jgi:hypothetical protein
MTARDLLNHLHGLPDKGLDEIVVVSPSTGGYWTADRIETLFAGPIVIHLEPETPNPNDHTVRRIGQCG